MHMQTRPVSQHQTTTIPPVSLLLHKQIMMHDFAITEHYALILDVPLVFDPQVRLGMPEASCGGGKACGCRILAGPPHACAPQCPPQVMIKHKQLPFVFEDRPARVGVLPRYAQSGAEIRWFTLGERLRARAQAGRVRRAVGRRRPCQPGACL